MSELVAAWFASGRIVDLAIAITLVEAIALIAWRRATGSGIAARQLIPNLAAGLCLMLAVRAALTGAAWSWLALALVGAGAAHCIDLVGRWPSAPTRRPDRADTAATAARKRAVAGVVPMARARNR